MDSFVTDISDDNHICIRCKQTINGLDNYVEHRKSGLCPHVTADNFFNNLQLKYKYKTIYASNEEEEEEETSVKSGHNQSSNNSDEDQSEEEMDLYRPPNNFTGGKWKPGSAPHSANRSNSGITSYISDDSSDSLEKNFDSKKRLNFEKRVKCNEEKDCLVPNTNPIQLKNDNYWDNCEENRETIVGNNNCLNEVIISNENEFKCKLCTFKAINSFDLLKHYLNSKSHSNSDVLALESIAKNESNLMRNLSFICEICSFYTNQSNNYFWHLTTLEHTIIQRSHSTHFECKLCVQTCDNVQQLMEHLDNNQSVHANSSGPLIVCQINKSPQNRVNSIYLLTNFKCDFCGKVFKFKTHLKKHTMGQHIRRVAFPDLIKSNFIGDNPKYCCLKCDFKTDKESTHLLHSVNHEMPVLSVPVESNRNMESIKSKLIKRNEDKYKCPLCEHSYIARQLKEHIHIHVNEKPYECIQCDKRFSKLVYLKSHEKSHLSIKDKVCKTCGKSFALNKLLINHMKIHNTNREKKDGCDVCGAMFYDKFTLLSHKKTHLPKNLRQFKCKFSGCRSAFVKKFDLIEHSKVHSSPDDKPVLCDRCPYKTKSIITFRKHYKQHMNGEKAFKCEFCHFTANSSSNLCRHLRIHTGVKPYSCPYCSYVCNTQENIRKHILKTKKHKGLYVYPCNHCLYKTNLFSDYRKHLEEIHSDLYTNERIDALVSHLFKCNK